MPLLPNPSERWNIRAGRTPGLLLDVRMAPHQFLAVIGAAEVGLFDALRDGPGDAASLAKATDSSPVGIEVLAKVLVSLGYLDDEEGHYALTEVSAKTLPIDDMPVIAAFLKEGVRQSLDIARVVRENPPGGVLGWGAIRSGEMALGYHALMRWLASSVVDEVARRATFPRAARRLLDVGGAHGLYTMALCRKYPLLQGTILDLPAGLASARQTLPLNPDVSDRIELVQGDFNQEDLPEGQDVVFLANIVHGQTAENNAELFQKVGRAMERRGVVLILEQVPDVPQTPLGKGIAAIFGLMLYLFSSGQAYPYPTLTGWLEDAGFGDIKRQELRVAPGFSLVSARKRPR
jgi:hypothetical protein